MPKINSIINEVNKTDEVNKNSIIKSSSDKGLSPEEKKEISKKLEDSSSAVVELEKDLANLKSLKDDSQKQYYVELAEKNSGSILASLSTIQSKYEAKLSDKDQYLLNESVAILINVIKNIPAAGKDQSLIDGVLKNTWNLGGKIDELFVDIMSS